ncbi:MAG: DUF2240 family protein [Candidatus Aenigmarchaeota archaeon]|nr:DUF2240 family protein [Candidatus Aenigmarchaeota archaeon]
MIDELIKKISSFSGLEERDIRSKIIDKQAELSGMISEEGAAYIVAKELGVSLTRKQERLKIENVVPGMQNADVVGKIIRAFPVKEFSTEKAKGRVRNIIVGDETGTARLSLWNDEIEKFNFNDGDVVRIRGFVRESLGGPEIRLGRYGLVQKSDEKIVVAARQVDRIKLSDLREGYYKEVRAVLVQVFESSPFYEVCAQCGSRIKDGKCEEHGDSKDYGLVVTGIIDDSTDSMRAVFFNEHAEKILNLKKDEAKRLFDSKKDVSAVMQNVSLGTEYVLEGKAKKNDFFDRLEFVVNNIKSVDVKKEIEILVG